MKAVTLTLTAAFLVLATATALLWAQDLNSQSQVSQAHEDFGAHEEALQLRLESATASAETLSQGRIAFRLQYDPSVISALGSVTSAAAATACSQATEATKGGTEPPPIEGAIQAATTGAESTYLALSDLPGWQDHLDRASVDAKAAECASLARKAKGATEASEKKEADTKKPSSRYWCVDEKGKRINSKTGCEEVYKRMGYVDPEGVWLE